MSNCKTCYAQVDLRTTVKCISCSADLHKDCSIKSDEEHYCDTCYIEKDTRPAKRDADFVMPSSIRRSNIELYLKCPYAFKLNQQKTQEGEGTIYTRLGIDLHNMFDIHAKHGMLEADMYKSLDLCWETYTDKLFGDADKEVMYQRGKDCIAAFYKRDMPTNPLALEEKIEFPIADGMPTVNITMDRVDEAEDDMLDITDWKTGKVMSGKKLTTDLQVPLYVHAVHTKYKRPVRKFTLVYLNEDKERVFSRINDDEYVCMVKKNEYRVSIREALGRVNTVFSKIKNREFTIPVDARSMYFTCKMCEFKASGQCRGAEEQSWYQAKEGRA